MITEDYVSFETANLLKEKGFNDVCYASYDSRGNIYHSSIPFTNENTLKSRCVAPTHQMVIKWFRNIYNIHIFIDWTYINKSLKTEDIGINYYYMINSPTKNVTTTNIFYTKYEDAAEAAIKICLKNLI